MKEQAFFGAQRCAGNGCEADIQDSIEGIACIEQDTCNMALQYKLGI